MPDNAHVPLPAVLAGPLLRRLEPGRLVLWLVASGELNLHLWLQPTELRDGNVPEHRVFRAYWDLATPDSFAARSSDTR